jgi:carbamoyltransferase
MNILGINGMGISPSACLLQNGELIAFAEEERFNRLKGSFGKMPEKASKYCLQEGGLQLCDVDYIAFGWDARLYRTFIPFFFAKKFFSRARRTRKGDGAFRVAEEMLKYRQGNIEQQLYLMFRSAGMQGPIPPVHFYAHHLSHAASTYYCSGFQESLIAVLDGSGEFQSTSIFEAKGSEIKLLEQFEIPDSLGWFYQAITDYLGFTPNSHEGKVMALAAYGERDEKIFKKLRKVLHMEGVGKYRHDPKFSFAGGHTFGRVYSDELVALLGPSRQKNEPLTLYHQNIAYASQHLLEEAAVAILSKYIKDQHFKGNICLAGGVALNCKMNGLIAQQEGVSEIYVPPHCSDAGAALGAALLLAKDIGQFKPFEMQHAFWGHDIGSEDIETLLRKMGLRYKREASVANTAAALLAEGKTLAWCQGRMEVGSRALGHRSILANPTKVETRDFVNAQIKSREGWRPFAASILEEYQEEYLQYPQKAPFMTLAFEVKEQFKAVAPAAIHIDGTTRPQLVSKSVDPKYWDLIKFFGDQTGVYAVLNTSFNLNEEPIVCTATDAIRTFFSSALDYLIIEDYLISK